MKPFLPVNSPTLDQTQSPHIQIHSVAVEGLMAIFLPNPVLQTEVSEEKPEKETLSRAYQRTYFQLRFRKLIAPKNSRASGQKAPPQKAHRTKANKPKANNQKASLGKCPPWQNAVHYK